MRETSASPVRLSDFDFELPESQIAQYPAPQREDSRLLVLEQASGALHLGRFPDIVDWFRPGDLLVLNDTRVIPARLLGRKDSGGRVEALLVRRLAGAEERWCCLLRASKAPRAGMQLLFDGGLTATVEEGGEEPYRQLRFEVDGPFLETLERVGKIPLPPYIRRQDEGQDRERYQTVFARHAGAVAAPTAGLHFTEAILERLRHKGVETAAVTLHVGLGTFLPVRVDDVREHRMHGEDYQVPEATAAAVNRARAEGRRVIALGTTSVRTLEHAVGADGRLRAGAGVSDLFIYPPYQFRLTDGLVTNFHLPCSTLLMLVSAFAGRDRTLAAYRRAVAEGFRFFSYGDCMLIV